MMKSIEKTLQRIEKLLVESIPSTVKAARVDEPVYSLRIWYNGTESEADAIPWLMLVKESTRRDLVAKAGKRLPEEIWMADELTNVGQGFQIHLEDGELVAEYGQWYEHLCDQDDDEALQPFREMIQRVAARLSQLDWTTIAPVTDDFVVFPADGSHTIGDDFEDLRASVPADRLKLLKSRKLWK